MLIQEHSFPCELREESFLFIASLLKWKIACLFLFSHSYLSLTLFHLLIKLSQSCSPRKENGIKLIIAKVMQPILTTYNYILIIIQSHFLQTQKSYINYHHLLLLTPFQLLQAHVPNSNFKKKKKKEHSS